MMIYIFNEACQTRDVKFQHSNTITVKISQGLNSLNYSHSLLLDKNFYTGKAFDLPRFFFLSFPVPFLYTARTKAVLTGLRAY